MGFNPYEIATLASGYLKGKRLAREDAAKLVQWQQEQSLKELQANNEADYHKELAATGRQRADTYDTHIGNQDTNAKEKLGYQKTHWDATDLNSTNRTNIYGQAVTGNQWLTRQRLGMAGMADVAKNGTWIAAQDPDTQARVLGGLVPTGSVPQYNPNSPPGSGTPYDAPPQAGPVAPNVAPPMSNPAPVAGVPTTPMTINANPKDTVAIDYRKQQIAALAQKIGLDKIKSKDALISTIGNLSGPQQIIVAKTWNEINPDKIEVPNWKYGSRTTPYYKPTQTQQATINALNIGGDVRQGQLALNAQNTDSLIATRKAEVNNAAARLANDTKRVGLEQQRVDHMVKSAAGVNPAARAYLTNQNEAIKSIDSRILAGSKKRLDILTLPVFIGKGIPPTGYQTLAEHDSRLAAVNTDIATNQAQRDRAWGTLSHAFKQMGVDPDTPSSDNVPSIVAAPTIKAPSGYVAKPKDGTTPRSTTGKPLKLDPVPGAPGLQVDKSTGIFYRSGTPLNHRVKRAK